METLEVHSKDFLVKWVHAPDNCIIDWYVKPVKKSINFAIYRKSADSSESKENSESPVPRSGSGVSREEHANGSGTADSVSSVNVAASKLHKTRSRLMSRSSSFNENLEQSDLQLVKHYNKLIAGELVHGKYEVERGGTFAFIFDNSFSKTTMKKVLFSSKILFASPGSNEVYRRKMFALKKTSIHDLRSNGGGRTLLAPKYNGAEDDDDDTLHSVLLKKRRKVLQGYVKRYFLLNFKYGTLSYFRVNDNKLRGLMPVRHSIISANPKSREIIIDSGMEVWSLKALNNTDFQNWIDAFNKVKRSQCDFDQEHHNDDADISDAVHDLEGVAKQLNTLKFKNDSPSDELLQKVLGISDDVEHALDKLRSAILSHNVNEAKSTYSNNEFHDANEFNDNLSAGVVFLDRSGGKGSSLEDSDVSDYGDDNEIISTNSSELDLGDFQDSRKKPAKAQSTTKSTHAQLYPLPHEPVKRDYDIPVSVLQPPSLLGFLRKNVGKDLSNIAMPVEMNEPLSFLQKYSEMFEYCDLIDNALQILSSDDCGEKVLRIAAFAVSSLSCLRMKERNARKPFNPLLGETYELVREDFGIRYVSEKVCHKPAVFAIFAESKEWTFSFSPSPSQKFWGKNAEISIKGVCTLTIRDTGEVFTWTQPTTLLKNIIAGEKYSEPSAPITVKSSFGGGAVVEFDKSGMFSGRSEGLTIKAYDSNKNILPYSITGKWTESLTLKTDSTEKLIWTVGELLPNSSQKYGFTKFAGTLNKITPLEKDQIPPTDSRLRPDIRYYEQGNVESAEKTKLELEEAQRQRRKELEMKKEQYKPFFFTHVGGDTPDSGEWVYVNGDKSYWNRRKNNDWNDLPKLW